MRMGVCVCVCVCVFRLVDNMPSLEAAKPANTDEAAAESAVEMDMLESTLILDAAIEDEIDKIIKFLEEIAKVLANADSVIVSIAYCLTFCKCSHRCSFQTVDLSSSAR